jgi:hypothetical protein
LPYSKRCLTSTVKSHSEPPSLNRPPTTSCASAGSGRCGAEATSSAGAGPRGVSHSSARLRRWSGWLVRRRHRVVVVAVSGAAGSIRPVPLAPLVVEAIRRQLPATSDPEALVFTGPGGGAAVSRGTRTVLSRHNFWRTYQAAVAKLADPVTELRPTAIRTLKALRVDGGQTVEQLAADSPERPTRPTGNHPACSMSSPQPAWSLQPTNSKPVAGRRSQPPATRSWTPSTCMGPMTSATRSPPGWRTPASRLE